MKRLFAPLIIVTVVVIGVSTAFVLAPQPPKSVLASSVIVFSDVITGECTVTFMTADGEILAEFQTVEGRIPVEKIPNAPFVLHRPFLRWTNIQGFSLDGVITQNITFLPLYSYDPTWDGTGGDNGGDNGNNGGNKIPGEYKETQWVWMNYILTGDQVILGAFLGIIFLLAVVFIFLKLLRGVFHK